MRLRTGFLALLMMVSGCAQLAGNLRRDLDDGEGYNSAPTVGGVWQERGFLAESMPEGGPLSGRLGSVGHTERGPASLGSSSSNEGSPWMSASQMDADRRDTLRRGYESEEEAQQEATYSSQPNLRPDSKRLYKNGLRATRADFIDEATNEGSLWASDGQTNYYFTKNKIRGVGDIITVKLEDDMIRDFGLEIRRGLTNMERSKEYSLARERLRKGPSDTVASSAAAPARGPAAANGAPAARAEEPRPESGKPGSEGPEPSLTDIDVSKSLELKSGDPMMAEIIERFPNGNYKIRGTKKVAYRNGSSRVVTLIGVARGNDIGEDDTIGSGRLYEYRLEAFR